MKINKKSWHYRWMQKIGFRHPTNLCAYFWKTVWSTLVFPVVAIGALFATIVVTAPFWSLFIDNGDIQSFAAAVGVIEILFLILALGIQFRDRWDEEEFAKYGYGGKPRESSDLFRLWLKAKHDKVCPYLEFE